MARVRKSETRSDRRRRPTEDPEPPTLFDSPATRPKKQEPITAQTQAQARYIAAIQGKVLTFGLGPAGTGKTWLATAMAAEAFATKQIDRILLTRPAVEAGEKLGFLPGTVDEKIEPYLRPFREVLEQRLGKGALEYALKAGKIAPMPIAYMRGLTFRDCWVLLDEAQNTTPTQMKLFLTRIGENAKVIVNGDPAQKDIPGKSGLWDAAARLKSDPEVAAIRFGRADVVRSGLCQRVLDAYALNEEDAEDEEGGLRRVLNP
jgi:phosphate starvation-inducible PhoH-like protein